MNEKRGLTYKNKRAQLEISFGMIFSIILIIAFISFAIFGIIKIIDLQNEALINNFIKNLQGDVDEIWRSQIYNSGKEYSYNLPSNIEKVCFKDSSKNILVYNKKDNFPIKEGKMNNLAISKMLNAELEKCFYGKNGKFKFILEKPEGEVLVTIKEST